MTKNSAEGIGFVVGGTVTGASAWTTIGGMGLVGGFGGISLGVGAMTGLGAIGGAATYGAFKAIEKGDSAAFGAIGMGALGGAGLSTAIGGMGLSFGGTAVGIGMGSMAVAGGVVGIGIYGVYQILQGTSTETKYIQNLLTLEQMTREYEEEICWTNLEFEEELQTLKATIEAESQINHGKNSSTSIPNPKLESSYTQQDEASRENHHRKFG